MVTNIYISLTQFIHISMHSRADAAAITFCSIIVVQVQSSTFAQHHHLTTFPWKLMVCTSQLNFNHFPLLLLMHEPFPILNSSSSSLICMRKIYLTTFLRLNFQHHYFFILTKKNKNMLAHITSQWCLLA